MCQQVCPLCSPIGTRLIEKLADVAPIVVNQDLCVNNRHPLRQRKFCPFPRITDKHVVNRSWPTVRHSNVNGANIVAVQKLQEPL